jgi:hypothetical protein
MAWESRNGRGAYDTRSRRCEGKVIREYIGSDETAKVIAKIDDIERQVRKEELVAQRELRAELDAIDTHAEQLGELADVLMRAIIIASGYHQHKGGEWRKYRERKPVNQGTKA